MLHPSGKTGLYAEGQAWDTEKRTNADSSTVRDGFAAGAEKKDFGINLLRAQVGSLPS